SFGICGVVIFSFISLPMAKRARHLSESEMCKVMKESDFAVSDDSASDISIYSESEGFFSSDAEECNYEEQLPLHVFPEPAVGLLK
ncbi:hypothetical protein NPIL_697561, partial [Nephila pilipes]